MASLSFSSTAIHHAIYHLKSQSVISLCEALDDNQFNEVMLLAVQVGGCNNMTCLQSAMLWQLPEVSTYLIDRMTQSCLREVLMIKNNFAQSPFPSILSVCSYTAINKCLQVLNDESLRIIFDDAQREPYQCLLLNQEISEEQANNILSTCFYVA